MNSTTKSNKCYMNTIKLFQPQTRIKFAFEPCDICATDGFMNFRIHIEYYEVLC